MNILITGAAGFIGSVATQTLSRNHYIYAMVRNRPTFSQENIEWIVQDISNPLNGLPKKIDAIIHLAQSRFYKHFPAKAQDIFDVNIHGTFKLLEYARAAGAKSFIHASSGGVYGYSYEKFVEGDPVTALNFYLSSKYASELLLANYKSFFNTIVLRLFFVYGPGQTGMLIPTLLGKVSSGEEIRIEGNPGCKINPIYIEDAVRVFEPALALQHPDLFNVSGNEIVSITDIVNQMEKSTNREARISYVDANLPGDLLGDNSRMKSILGVTPSISVATGISGMVR